MVATVTLIAIWNRGGKICINKHKTFRNNLHSMGFSKTPISFVLHGLLFTFFLFSFFVFILMNKTKWKRICTNYQGSSGFVNTLEYAKCSFDPLKAERVKSCSHFFFCLSVYASCFISFFSWCSLSIFVLMPWRVNFR